MPKTITASDGTVLDAGVVNLAKAIRIRESKGNYNAVGDAGTSKGAYQWQPGNFQSAAKQYGLDPNDFSPVNQDKVAYQQVKALKDKGYTPEQVAASWNAGEGSLKNDAWKSYVGDKTINGQKIHYDTPGYVNSVIQEFNKAKGQSQTGGYNPTPYSNPTSPGLVDFSGGQTATTPQNIDHSYLGDLGAEATKAGAGASKAFQDTTSGKINPLSGVIQGLGSLAGGVSGLINTSIEHAPVIGGLYKGAEDLVGQGIQAAAGTDLGKQVTGAAGDFAKAHPELAGDAGGLINIASLLPLGKGLTLGKEAASGAVTGVLKKQVTGAAEKELADNIGVRATKGLVSAQKRGVDPIKTIVSNKAFLPEVVRSGDKFVYDTAKASEALNSTLSTQEEKLQQMLKEGVKKNIGVDLDQVRAKVLKDVQKEYSLSGNYKPAVKAVNDYFDSFGESTGGRKIIDLNELNGMKRDVRNAVFDVSGDVRGTASADIKYNIGQSLMKQVEETAKKAGVKDVGALNKEMSSNIEALKVLKGISGKSVKGGSATTRELSRDAAGIMGEVAGNTMGVPLAGTFAGRGLAGLLSRRIPRTAIHKLQTLNPTKTTLKAAGKSTLKGLVSADIGRNLQNQ